MNVLKLLIFSEMLTGDSVGSSPGEPGRWYTPSCQLRPAAVRRSRDAGSRRGA